MMEFKTDPGPLPIKTVRRQDPWEGRVTGVDGIEVRMPNGVEGMLRVVSCVPYTGPVPPELASIYTPGTRLVEITLDRMPHPVRPAMQPAEEPDGMDPVEEPDGMVPFEAPDGMCPPYQKDAHTPE